jgi:hypothetical protein
MGNLFAQISAPDALTVNDKQAMYALYSEYYDACDRQLFTADLEEKQHVILLRNAARQVCGFTTLMVIDFEFRGASQRAIFSGDTIALVLVSYCERLPDLPLSTLICEDLLSDLA